MYQVIKINHTLNIHVHEGSQANPYEPIRGHVALCDFTFLVARWHSAYACINPTAFTNPWSIGSQFENCVLHNGCIVKYSKTLLK